MDNMDNMERISVWKRLAGRVGLRSTAVAIVLIAMAFHAIAMRQALAAPGTVTVTATMGAFSPSLVRVGDSVISQLSASQGELVPAPSMADEGSLVYSYSWSDSVQYKALYSGTYGSPPMDSYTDSISPQSPSATSDATLTFTPKIAGYWEVTVTCSLGVTDKNNANDTWGGSGNAGPDYLTSAATDLTISVNGAQISGQAENNPGVDLPIEPQYQDDDPSTPTPIFTVAATAPADCTVTLNWTNASDVVVVSSADGSIISPGQQVPATSGPFSFYAYATPYFGSGSVEFTVAAKPPSGGTLNDP